MKHNPSTVTTYLQSVCHTYSEPAFLHLDHNNRLIEWSDNINQYGLERPQEQMLVLDQLKFLQDLLPCSDKAFVVPRVQFLMDQYYDLHLFSNHLGQWIVFLDTTFATRQAQAEQQVRLSRELELETQSDR